MLEITIFGLVQGVGFRPFVAEAARELSISGTVWNAGGIVKVRAASHDAEALDEFIRRLSSCSLPGARVDEVRVEDREGEPEEGFRIVSSESREDELRFFPADIATCETCERELLDPANRRYRYPFISCVSCGPRFSIMEAVPYDRERTTMAGFGLCEECQKEYETIGDIRCYAQTIACEACGPQLALYAEGVGADVSGAAGSADVGERVADAAGEDALTQAVALLKAGKILAIKDIGGYHFCFDPYNEETAIRLREYKDREEKPLAVMFPDVASIREMAEVSEKEEELLTSTARPIVLVDKKKGKDFTFSVCGSSPRIGAMLPCNPLQILLMKECGPLVMTSGNRGGEPIITDDKTMLDAWEAGFPDAVLTHDRTIVNGVDDSIYQVVRIGGEEIVQILRRARGLVPEPVQLPVSLAQDTFAAGGDLKAVFALGRGDKAYLSGHFGDLEDSRAAEARERGIDSLSELLGIRPERAVCDKHPGYHSVKQLKEKLPTTCQHHYAHIASVMAEHGLTDPVIGVAFDGTGYGDDQTIWGGEFLLCDEGHYTRKANLIAVPLIGGDASALDARTTLYAYLHAALQRDLLTEGEITEIVNHMDVAASVNNYHIVASALEADVNTVYMSSMGRLFDAVSALLRCEFINTYEGQCAQSLQAAAEKWYRENRAGEDASDDMEIPDVWAPVKGVKGLANWRVDGVYLLAGLARHLLYGEDPGYLAYEFHEALAMATTETCVSIRQAYDEETADESAEFPVALGGGCMCNALLLRLLMTKLRAAGFRVYVNEQVPPGDGGIALGQLYATALTERA